MCKTPNTERTPTIKPQTVKEAILGQPAPIFSQACRKGPLHRRTTQCYQRRKSTQQSNTKILSKTKNGGRSHPRTTSTSLLFSGVVCRTGSNTKEQQCPDVIKDDKARAPSIRQTKEEVIPGLDHPLSSPGAWRRTPGRVRRGVGGGGERGAVPAGPTAATCVTRERSGSLTTPAEHANHALGVAEGRGLDSRGMRSPVITANHSRHLLSSRCHKTSILAAGSAIRHLVFTWLSWPAGEALGEITRFPDLPTQLFSFRFPLQVSFALLI